ncbi:unnamed protein product, partial [Rotaria sordida]
MNSVRYPYIVTFYGACTETGKYALVMEYMSLGSLYKILHKDKLSLDWFNRLSVALQAAKGINYLHKLQPPILHRDIKSLNLLLDEFRAGYIVKVCDFGLAQTRNETTRQTVLTHALPCTLQWTAPEILRLKKHTNKSDVYSLGIVYWELAANEIPYDEHQNAVIREFVLSGERLDIPQTTPLKFATLITKCWTNEPKDRPDCSQIIDIIEQCIEDQIIIPNIPVDATWQPKGTTVAGGMGEGNDSNQLNHPLGLFIDDDDQMIVIADSDNHRIVQWKIGDTKGQVVAGGKGKGNRLNQLNGPTDVLIDKETNSFIICDYGNRRVVRWSHRSGTTQGEILIEPLIESAIFGFVDEPLPP